MPAAAPPPAKVPSIADEAPRNGSRVVTGLGIVEPASGEIDLAAAMLGVIGSIGVEEGDHVTRGTILAELVNDDLKAKLEQARATLAIKTAENERLRNGARPQELRRAEGDLRREEATLQLLRLQAQRRQKLGKSGSVAQEAVDSADSALKAGRERRDSAEQALLMMREGERAETLAASAATVDLARFQLAEAEAALAKSFVRATSDGVVLRLSKEAGEAVSTQPAMPIVQIGDLSQLVVRAQIDESDIAELRLGQSARISAPALQGQTVTGRVTRISPRLGAKTVTDGSPTKKRDARVLDVIVTLDTWIALPISLRVDVFIDLDGVPTASGDGQPVRVATWSLRP